jgi:hypothetical protein
LIQGTVNVPGTVAGGVTGGVACEVVLANGGAVDLGHSWQIVVSAEVVVLHGMVTIGGSGGGGGRMDELVIKGLLAAPVMF